MTRLNNILNESDKDAKICSEKQEDFKTSVSIGLPIYNGEKFIHEKINSLLKQTFTDFELIISDNCSTDLTSQICKEYSNRDKRIIYFRQKKNIGSWANFAFVLNKASNKYFLWTAVDDFVLPQFIEENVKTLEADEKIACSISKIRLFGKNTDKIQPNEKDSKIKKIKKNFLRNYGHMNTFPARGTFEKRINEYIKNLRHNQCFYGIYRTDLIKKAFITKPFLGQDACIIFNILKFGELNVVNKVLMEVYDDGVSRRGMIGLAKALEYNLFSTIFPSYQFTKWCKENLGLKIFLKNLGFFIKINFISEISLLIDILRKLVQRF